LAAQFTGGRMQPLLRGKHVVPGARPAPEITRTLAGHPDQPRGEDGQQ
jgi:hypothetical protein